MSFPSARPVRWFARLALCGTIWSGAAFAQTAPPPAPQVVTAGGQKVRIVTIPGFTFPWAIAFLPNGDALVSEKNRSTLRIIRNGALDPTPITGLPPMLQSTRGIRGGVDVIVHPQFATNHWVYFAYHKTMPGKPEIAQAVLGRGRFDGGHTLTDVKDLFVSEAWNSDGDAVRVTFGQDGKIYMVIGAGTNNKYRTPASDYGTSMDAQDPLKDAGKVLRLNEDGSIPKDNPFVGNPKYRPEIYALGIRNSLGMFSEPGTGKLWLTDNGPRGGDELNIIKPGLNYGWPLVTYGRAYVDDPEGKWSTNNVPADVQPPSTAPGLEPPFLFWVPSPSVSGIIIYSGDKFPGWKGNILIGALRAQRVERITLTRQGLENARSTMLGDLGRRIRDVKQGPDGLIYLVAEDGAVLRLEPADPAPGAPSR